MATSDVIKRPSEINQRFEHDTADGADVPYVKILGEIQADLVNVETVNSYPIVGQSGVDGGAGAVSDKTQRTTLASDDPLVTATGAKNDAAAADDTGTYSLLAFVKRLLQKFTSGLLLAAGESYIGKVGTFTNSVRSALTVTAGTYGAGKCVGGVQTVNLCRAAGVGFTLNAIVLQDVGGSTKPTGNILVFNASPASSTTSDNSTFSLHASDEDKQIGVIPVTSADWKTPATKSIAEVSINKVYTPTSGTSLYFLFVADATYGSAFSGTGVFAMRYKGY